MKSLLTILQFIDTSTKAHEAGLPIIYFDNIRNPETHFWTAFEKEQKHVLKKYVL